MGFVALSFGDVPILRDLTVVLIQGYNGKAQRSEDLCKTVDPALFKSGSLSNPIGISEWLNDQLVGEYDAEYREAGTAAREKEARTATLLKDGLELGLRQWKYNKTRRPQTLFKVRSSRTEYAA